MEEQKEKSRMEILTVTAFLFGVVGLVLAMLNKNYISLGCGIAAAMLGFVQTKKEKKKVEEEQTNMAVWSLIMGVATIFIIVLFRFVKL